MMKILKEFPEFIIMKLNMKVIFIVFKFFPLRNDFYIKFELLKLELNPINKSYYYNYYFP